MHFLSRSHTIFIILFTLSFTVSCATNPVTGRRELSLVTMSTEQEIALGRKTFPVALQQSGGKYPNEELQTYVNQVGQRLVQVCERPDLPFQFAVVNNSTPNAFALPGGQIAITRGLLVNLTNEEQLAAVLGHEIAHVTARHAVQGMNRGALLETGLAVLAGVTASSDYASISRQAGLLTATLLDRTYSRTQESDSDRLGINYMVAAGYDPQGAVELQEFFYREVQQGRRGSRLEGIFRSHPFSRDRLKRNRATLTTLTTLPSAGITNRTERNTRFLTATALLRETQTAYAQHDQAVALERNGKTREAIALYLQAAAAAPEEASLRTALGMAELRAGDRVAAKRQLRKAVRLDGDYYQSRLGLGYLYLLEKNLPRALTHLKAAQKLLPTIRGTYLIAETHDKSGRSGEAFKYYRQVVDQEPQSRLGQAASARITELERYQGTKQ